MDPRSNREDHVWIDETVGPGAFDGETVDLILGILPGPTGDAKSDWIGWSTPVLVADDMAVLNPVTPGNASPQDVQQ